MAKKADPSVIEKRMAEKPDEFFSPEETGRRMTEMMARLDGRPATMNMATGQNLQPPFLTEAELKVRGYPIEAWWQKGEPA